MYIYIHIKCLRYTIFFYVQVLFKYINQFEERLFAVNTKSKVIPDFRSIWLKQMFHRSMTDDMY